MTPHPKLVLGTMTFGSGSGGRISDLQKVQEILDIFKAHGHDELDTARMYCDGNTEEVLGKLEVQRTFKLATKVYPKEPGQHQPEKLKATFRESFKALNTKRVDIFYLHAPDHATPFEVTLRAVQDLYEEGSFGELGLSNYTAWQVMQIWWICKTNGYVLPTIYQGMYNAITRDTERELIPCLRTLGIRFYAYNPLCGGLLSGHYKFEEIPSEGRFASHTQGEMYRKRYWNDVYFDAVEKIKAATQAEGLTVVEAAHRWLIHHSKLDFSKGHAIIIGASSRDHAQQNLDDCEKGPLPDSILTAFDDAWLKTKSIAVPYFR
ncbi:hypothetical protein HK097_010717 [Rhizophlyctis rosea]|uniref:NADP-dependent oxidoreductase domain-containing protein n=1 Tax=Rhizophlyctis rosea TaxID=64517 RepID=A0AAD5X7Y5_9FUNG|nr:hypothetical protein HK097_010717 [Rhizophlyctis rosea]